MAATGAYKGRGPQWAQKLAAEANAAKMAALEAELAAVHSLLESRGAGLFDNFSVDPSGRFQEI